MGIDYPFFIYAFFFLVVSLRILLYLELRNNNIIEPKEKYQPCTAIVFLPFCYENSTYKLHICNHAVNLCSAEA